MFDSHGYYGQPGQTAQQFLPQGLFGAAPTGFSPYAAFGTLPGPWGHPTGPSIGGWPGQQLPLGAFAPQGLFGGLPANTLSFGAFGSPRQSPVPPGPQSGRSAVCRASRHSSGPYPHGAGRLATRSVHGRGRCSSLASRRRGSSPFCRVSLRSRSGLGSRSGRSEPGRAAAAAARQPFRRRGGAQLPAIPGTVPDGLRLSS